MVQQRMIRRRRLEFADSRRGLVIDKNPLANGHTLVANVCTGKLGWRGYQLGNDIL